MDETPVQGPLVKRRRVVRGANTTGRREESGMDRRKWKWQWKESGLARNLRIGQLIAVEGMSCIVMAVLYGGRWR